MSEMTQTIIDLRRGGMGYNEIAKRLGTAKHVVVYYCKKFGLTGVMVDQTHNPNKLDEKTVADYVDRSGFDYVGGYQMAKKPITVRCRDCGRTFERQFHIFRDVVNGTWPFGNECPLCRKDMVDAKERDRQEKREKAQHEARIKAERRERELANLISRQVEERLAIHVCKNCGQEYCIESTGYNSERYCSEKCMKRYVMRVKNDRRLRRMKTRNHDTDITLEKLFRKEDGICYLCGKPCDWSDMVEGIAGGDYPSIDHVRPISKGGTHEWSNVRLAHRKCNTAKGNVE